MQKHNLLVDSDAENLARLSQTLRLHDYRVSVARDGVEGLEKFRAGGPFAIP